MGDADRAGLRHGPLSGLSRPEQSRLQRQPPARRRGRRAREDRTGVHYSGPRGWRTEASRPARSTPTRRFSPSGSSKRTALKRSPILSTTTLRPLVAFGKSHRPGFSTYPQPGLFGQIYEETARHGHPAWASSEGTNCSSATVPASRAWTWKPTWPACSITGRPW